jgi:fumarate hydratase subunit beta
VETLGKEVRLSTPLSREEVRDLEVGDVVHISGPVFTARDMAHKRILEHLRDGRGLVEDLEGGALFHAGPVVRRRDGGWEVIAIGPTSSIRMEPYSEAILGRLGVRAIIGKGGMGEETLSALERHCGVYLLSPPGCAAIQGRALRRVLRVHWLDLGIPEAIWVLEAEDWGPLIVGMDSRGGSIFRMVRERALKRLSELLGDGVDAR